MALHAQVIFLNGPSGAGKTTLAKALQKELDEPYLHIGIDKMIGLMPAKVNDWDGGYKEEGFCWLPTQDGQGHEIHMGPFAQKISRTFKDVVQLLVNSGYNVIIDEVAFGGKEVEHWRKTLEGIPTLFVGISAPIKVLEEREIARGDRFIGGAKVQAKRVHEGAHYDLMLDSHASTLEENVKMILTLAKKTTR